ncbi:MAG: ORF6N domain-containing protein [Bryobacteraceae bacterium]
MIERRIYIIRSQKVLLSTHLAELYEVEPRALVQAVKRNSDRFPADFMFQLSAKEFANLKSQIVISSWGGLRRAVPYAFTEQGVAILSSVLDSKRAIAVNIAIIRTFVRLRQILARHKDFAERLAAMENKYDQRFKVVFDILKQLMEPPPQPRKRPIGFTANSSRISARLPQ